MHSILGDDSVNVIPPSRRTPGAEGATQASPSRAARPEPGRGGGACRHGCSGGCYCLVLELESAEAAGEPKPILEQRLPPPGPERVPQPLEIQDTPRLSRHASARVLSQDRGAACDSRLRAGPDQLPPPFAGHNCQGDLPEPPCPPDSSPQKSH